MLARGQLRLWLPFFLTTRSLAPSTALARRFAYDRLREPPPLFEYLDTNNRFTVQRTDNPPYGTHRGHAFRQTSVFTLLASLVPFPHTSGYARFFGACAASLRWHSTFIGA